MTQPAHERYGHKLFPGSSHSWAISEVAKLTPGRLLDIGPGSGIMGQVLSQMGWSETCAVEIDAEARKHVTPLYSRVSESIDEFEDKQFDLILLLDVLEHMVHPEEFLTRVARLLAPGGAILISVPNIAHWSIRLSLAAGFFEYTDKGILDRTHLQFFSRRRFQKFISSVPSLTIRSTSGSIPPAELVLPKVVTSWAAWDKFCRFRKWFAHNIPGLFAYQHLAVLSKA